MAIFRGDGMKTIREAVREKDLRRKVELMTDGLLLHFVELEKVFTSLGVENFSALGLKELAKEIRKEGE